MDYHSYSTAVLGNALAQTLTKGGRKVFRLLDGYRTGGGMLTVRNLDSMTKWGLYTVFRTPGNREHLPFVVSDQLSYQNIG